nr:MAG TPA: hypothetical protein [Bacteriophage sp.]
MNATKYSFCGVRFFTEVLITTVITEISELYTDIRAYCVYYAVHKHGNRVYKAVFCACWLRVHPSVSLAPHLLSPRAARVCRAARVYSTRSKVWRA